MELEGKCVLVADDEAQIRFIVGAAFANAGATVIEAEDGAEAVRQANTGGPDILIMDLNMPGTGGIEAIRGLRLIQPDLPILVLTGFSTEENLRAAREAGATDVMVKPPELRERVAKAVTLLAD